MSWLVILNFIGNVLIYSIRLGVEYYEKINWSIKNVIKIIYPQIKNYKSLNLIKN